MILVVAREGMFGDIMGSDTDDSGSGRGRDIGNIMQSDPGDLGGGPGRDILVTSLEVTLIILIVAQEERFW